MAYNLTTGAYKRPLHNHPTGLQSQVLSDPADDSDSRHTSGRRNACLLLLDAVLPTRLAVYGHD